MKNKGLIKKYTIALLVCFFALIIDVKAQVYDQFYLTLGQYFTIGDSSFQQMSCSSNSPVVKVESTDIVGAKKVTYYTKDTNVNNVEVTCNWKKQSAIGDPTEGTAVYRFTLEHDENVFHEGDEAFPTTVGITIHSQKDTEVSVDVVDYIGSTMSSKFTRYEFEYGSEWLDISSSCSGTGCEIKPSQATYGIAGQNDLLSSFKFYYRDDSGEEKYILVNVTISTFNSVNIFPGDYGTCSINTSIWKQGEYKNATFYSSTTSATLPDCDGSNAGAPVTFKGWTKTVPGELNNQVSDHCWNVAPANSPAELGSSYAACYERNAMVTISFYKGELASPGEWKSMGGSEYTYYYSGSESVALPTINVEGFKGWRKNGFSGPLVNAGETVEVDGSTYYADIESTIEYRDYKKAVRVGKTMAVAPTGITGCSTGSSKVSVSYTSNECQVTGVEETNRGEYADVIVTLENETSLIFNFSVLADSSGKDDSEFIIDTTPNIVYGDNYYGSDTGHNAEGADGAVYSGISGICSELQIKWGGKTDDPNKYFGGDDGVIQSSGYEIQPCGGTNFWGFCLDPGLPGPDSSQVYNTYVVTDLLNSADNLKKTMSYIISVVPNVDSIVNSNNDSTKIAIHHATRIAAMMDGIDGGTNDHYASRYNYYRRTTTAVQACNGDKDCIKEAIKTKFTTYSINSTREDIINKMADYLSGGYSLTVDASPVTKTPHETESTVSGSITTNTITGSLILPSTAKNPVLTACGSNSFGITCEVVSTEPLSDTAEGKKELKYVIRLSKNALVTSNVPKTTAEKKTVSFKLTFEGSSIDKLALADSKYYAHSWQRLLIFNTGESETYLYIPFEANCDAYLSLVESYKTNPEAFPNQQDFVASGCCAELPETEEYKTFISGVCGQKCSYSFLDKVCNTHVTAGSVDLYSIKEGYKEGVGNQIGTCVVNVKMPYNPNDNVNFIRNDDVGNKFNVKDFTGISNEYCEVTCKEDWQIAMEAYGNYVGQNAVAAGTYFRVQTDDVFMSGKRECYTTYIDFAAFTKKMSKLSNNLSADANGAELGAGEVYLYNEYSRWSHRYTDINKQRNGEGAKNFSGSNNSYCVKRAECSDDYESDGVSKCIEKDPPNTCCTGDEAEGEACTAECDPQEYTPDCDETGYTLSWKLSTNRLVESGERDKEYKTKEVNNTENDANVPAYDNKDDILTTSNKLNGGNAMKNLYDKTEDLTCTGHDAVIPGSTADAPSCSSTVGGSFTNSDYCNGTSTNQSDYCSSTSGNEDKAFDDFSEVTLESYRDTASGYMSQLSAKTAKIYEEAQEFFKCQHFELYNNTEYTDIKDEEGNTVTFANNPEIKPDKYVLGKTVPFARINTGFNPGAAYTYDDKAYMTLLDDDNVLEMYIDKDNKHMSNFAGSTNKREKVEIDNVNLEGGGTDTAEVWLARNYTTTTYYYSKDYWLDSTEQSKNYDDPAKTLLKVEGNNPSAYDASQKGNITLCKIYSGDSITDSGFDADAQVVLQSELNSIEGVGDPLWGSGTCINVALNYKDSNYVKTSIENSSFYKNKGYWWTSNSSGLYVAHGDTFQDAVANLQNHAKSNSGTSIPKSEDNWKKSAYVNQFPVSLSTPRNIYTYTYNFGDIGYYNDSENLGRIMGGQKPIIKENKRTCFYEVFEEVCLCCGADDYDRTSTVNPGDYVDDYTPSDPGQISNNENGTLAITPSTIQLSDFNSDSNRDLSNTIWGTSPFYFDGITYNTGKGGDLLKLLESKGENIYDKNGENSYNLEYSYVLDPSTIATIRDYNDTYGYEISSDRVSIYGRYKIGSNDKSELYDSLDMKDGVDEISLVHYGSTFLEGYLPSSSVKKTLTGSSEVCYVEKAEELPDMMRNHTCRWVDYIGQVDKLSDKEAANNIQYARMAFK